MGRRRKRTNSNVSRRILYWLSQIVCGALVIFLFLTLAQCTVKKPEAPSWQANLVIPLVNKTWDMRELIEKIDQDNLTTDSFGNPFFFYRKVLDTIRLEGSFGIVNAADTLAESLGIVRLDPFTGTTAAVNLSEYMPLELGFIPPVSFDVSEPLPPVGEFVVITVESGFALVTLENNFGVDLDTVTVTLNDRVLGRPVTSYAVPGGVPAGEMRVDTIDLSGKTISNEFDLTMHCHTPGANSFSLSESSLAATLSLPEGPEVSWATARIPRIEKHFNEEVAIACEHRLQTATIEYGQVVINVDNSTNVPLGLRISLNDVKDGGVPVVIDQSVAPGQRGQFVRDLGGYTIVPADKPLPQALSITVDAVIDSSGTELVTFDAGDKISVTTSIQDITLASVQGIIAPTTAAFDNISRDIELPKGFDQAQLTSAAMTVEIANTVNIPGSFDVTISGDNGENTTIGGDIQRGTPDAPVTTTVINNDVSGFLNPVPQRVTINGAATFGDGVTVGSINVDDYLTPTITLSSPLEMILQETSFDGDWQSTKIDQDVVSKIVDNTNLATLHLSVVNHLPLEIDIAVLLGGDSLTLYSQPEVVLGPVTVTRGSLAPDGSVDTSAESEIILPLDSIQVQVFDHNPLWIGQVYTLKGSDGTVIKLTAGDSFAVSGYINVDLNVSDELWKD